MANDSADSSTVKRKARTGAATQQKPGTPATRGQIIALGLGLLLLALAVAYLFLAMWPSGMVQDAAGNSPQAISLLGQRIQFTITLDVRLLLMVMLAGGLGSFIHAATSFGDYVGNEKLTTNWVWWYILRPFIGMILAVIFYLVVRGGFLASGTEAGKINPFGVAALAGLVGMFSKQATDKLDEIFNTIFRTLAAGDSKRKDDLVNPVPSVTDIEPQSIETGTENLVVTVEGTGFVNGSVVRINDVNRETQFDDDTRLTAKLLPEDIEKEGEVNVTVFNPGPGGGASSPIKLKIAQAVVAAQSSEPRPPASLRQSPGTEGAGAITTPATGLTLSGRAVTPATPEPEFAAPPDAVDAESDVDGCDVPVEDATPDEELPASKGGVG